MGSKLGMDSEGNGELSETVMLNHHFTAIWSSAGSRCMEIELCMVKE